MGETSRQTRKSAQRDAFVSGKRFNAGCRSVSPTLWVASGGPPASSKVSTVAQGYAFRPSPIGALGGSDSARCDDGPILVRNPG